MPYYPPLQKEQSSKFLETINSLYDLEIIKKEDKTNKSCILHCRSGNCFLLKEIDKDHSFIYDFLSNLGVSNVVLPKSNIDDRFITKINNKFYYLTNYYRSNDTNINKKTADLFDELIRLHRNTSFPRKMSPEIYRKKFDELTKRIDYRFKILEDFVRSLETKKITHITYPVLEKYHIILDLKNELIKLQKKIIESIKDNQSVDYVFIHNNPKIDHLIYARGNKYLVSVDKGKIGIKSIDFAKFYIENCGIDIDMVSLIKNELLTNNTRFYYDYFRFNVLVSYLFNINVMSENTISYHSIIVNCDKIFQFMKDFNDQESN